jgi:hypothetical protein
LVKETPTTPGPTASPPYSPKPLRLIPCDTIASAYPCIAMSPHRHVVIMSPRPPRVELTFLCTHARGGLVRHMTVNNSEHTTPWHPCIAPLPSVVTPTCTRSHAHELKPQPFRPRHRATDATDHIPRFTSPYRARAPPLLADCFQRDHRGMSPTRQCKAPGQSGNSNSSLICPHSTPLLLQSTSPMEPLPLRRC